MTKADKSYELTRKASNIKRFLEAMKRPPTHLEFEMTVIWVNIRKALEESFRDIEVIDTSVEHDSELYELAVRKVEQGLDKALDNAWGYLYEYRCRSIKASIKLLEDLKYWTHQRPYLAVGDHYPYREKIAGLTKKLENELADLVQTEGQYKSFKGVSDRDLGLGLVEGVRAIDTYQLTQNHVETIKVDTAKWLANKEG